MTEPERMWNAYIEAWNTHNIDDVLAAVSEQFVYDERPMTMAAPLKGRRSFAKYLRGVFEVFPDLRIETTLCDTGSTVGIAESLMTGTYRGRRGVPLGRGKSISARVACVFEVTQGWLAHERLYWDRGNTMRQLGLWVAVASAASTPPVKFR
jgi:steroid delta-isomerase-like uncharacterized protein